MKLIVGLGNPGKKYVRTRHNTGYIVVDRVAQRLTARSPDNPESQWKPTRKFMLIYVRKEPRHGVVLAKPRVYMNKSGLAIRELVRLNNIDMQSLFVVHDDLDIALGRYKIQFGRGPHDHNGVNSIVEALGSGRFWRVRVGVENRPPSILGRPRKPAGEEYVLMNFNDLELGMIKNVADEVTSDLVSKHLTDL